MSRFWRAAVFVAWVATGCGASRRDETRPPESIDVAAKGAALLEPSAALPERAEAVALADAVAVASAKQGKTTEGARLAKLAADLRVRLWRFDRAAADGREALELYAAAAGALEGAERCAIERLRAGFAGELAGDGATAF